MASPPPASCANNEPGGFCQTGRLWLRGALTDEDMASFDALATAQETRPGARLSAHPVFAPDAPLGSCLARIWPGMAARRVVFFNKTASGNWGVPWHQDRIIAVRERADVPGFDRWTQKSGVWHCEPPLAVLAPMLFVRLHLDPCDVDTGAMDIALGSHCAGHVPERQAAEVAGRYPTETCTAARGDVLVLNMMTLHRSSPAKIATSRRTLRIDYSAHSLPPLLEWAL